MTQKHRKCVCVVCVWGEGVERGDGIRVNLWKEKRDDKSVGDRARVREDGGKNPLLELSSLK